MSILKAEPLGTVRSLDELFALAHRMESEAAATYSELARSMRAQGNAELADTLDQLAAEERGHVEAVDRWSDHRVGRAPNPAALGFAPPAPIAPEAAAELAASRLMTPYRALALAVENEERAFSFWSYVAAQAERPEVKRAAEDMAHEELRHVAILRRERRRAYHAARAGGASPTDASRSAADLRSLSPGPLERRMAELLDQRATTLAGETAERARQAAAEARRLAGTLGGAGEPTRAGNVGDLESVAERLVEIYLDAAETAADDADLVAAQGRAAIAIARLGWLRTLD